MQEVPDLPANLRAPAASVNIMLPSVETEVLLDFSKVFFLVVRFFI